MSAASEDAAEEQSLLANFGNHRLMDKVQAALQAQIKKNLLRVEADIRRQQEAKEGARKAREETGVELYNVQQQLARLQSDLESKQQSAVDTQEHRRTLEVEVRRAQESLASKKATVEEQNARLEKAKGELEGVLDTVRQVEKYNAEMNAEIALTRRKTQKAGEDLQEKEKAKVQQDVYIDYLTAQVKRAADQLSLLTQQSEVQRAEVAAASATMADAAQDMETIRFEKKQLILQWQASLLAMRRRDEAIMATQKQTKEIANEINAMDAEEGNLRKNLTSAQALHGRLQDMMDRVENDLKNVESQAAGLRRQHEALEERREQLAGTLDTTDAEVKKVLNEQVHLVRVMREVDSQRILLDKQRFDIESQIDSVNDAKITNEKAGLAMIRDAKKLVERSHQLDIQAAETENAIALAKVEALNLSSRIAALRESRNLRDSEVADKEKLVSQYEVENRQRADLIDKKQAIVDRLNRKWEKLSQAAPETANMGPLEAEVHNLRKQIDSIREESEALQRRWLTDQTTLVEATNESEVKLTKISENNAQAVLLNQKAIRLDSAIATQRSELKRLENGVKTMHDDMARINGLIAHNDALGKRLAGSTFTSERAFNAELHELELESASADAKLESLKEEKDRLLEDLVESERQVILWEKKIALERETQEALDPSAGEGEVQSMEREVHRMRHRYEALRRDQERLVKEMERAIDKREVIANKHRSARQITMDAAATVAKGMVSGAGSTGASASGVSAKFTSTTSGNSAELTRIGLQHKGANLRKQITTKLAQVEELDNQISVVSENARSAATEASEKQAELDALEEHARSIQRNIHIASFEKQKAIEHLQSVLRFHQRLQALEAERLPQLTADESAHAHARLNEAEVARDALRQIINLLAEQHSELSEVLGRVAQLTDAPELS